MAPLLLGIDVSHHQGAINWPRMYADGVRFAGLKATEGDGFIDPRFADNLRGCRGAGIEPFAYHYQRSVATAAEQVALIRRVVSRDVPVAVDVEAGSGPITLTRAIVAQLRRAGYVVPLSYIPKWYYNGIGSPTLVGLPPLWSSRYPDNTVRPIRTEYAEIEQRFQSFWVGYGGLPVVLLQFTSSALVGGRQPIDGNAFRGTPLAFQALMSQTIPSKEDPLAALTEAQQQELLSKVRELRLILDGLDEWSSPDKQWVARTLSGLRNNDVGVPTDGQSVHDRLGKVESGLASIASVVNAIASRVGV